jgi:hypothetical protein
VKHVFVETNFLVDLLRPFPVRDAKTLFGRIANDFVIHLPWVSVSEAKRTITTKIIREDLGFADLASKFNVHLLQTKVFSNQDAKIVQTFESHLKNEQRNALAAVEANVDGAVAKMSVIPPSPGVVAKTMALYPVKSLPPFDEMVLGAVLFRAQELFNKGEQALYFCNANTKDFGPTSGNALGAAYAACGLTYLSDFKVP